MQLICSRLSRGASPFGWAQPCVYALIAVLVQSCASTPPPKPISPEEQIRRDVAVGSQVAESFESRLKLRRDPEVSVYLRKLGQRITAHVPELKSAPLGVLVVDDRGGRWSNYSLPGNRVYLSAGWLRQTEFENEVAAAIAVELAHILRRDAVIRLTREPGVAKLEDSVIESVMPMPGSRTGKVTVEFFGPNGIFAFSDEERLGAAELAVDLLYRAGVDPRGVIELWNAYLKNPDRSAIEPELLGKLLERTRQAVALRAPLRNPIVRSREFLAVKKRIERL